MARCRIPASDACRMLPCGRVVRAVTIILALWAAGLGPLAHAGQPRQRGWEGATRYYTSAYFWTADAGVIADTQDIVVTRDGGATWTLVLSVYSDRPGLGIMGRLHTLTPQFWWFEDSGYLWRTTDQGQTWASQRLANAGQTVFVSPTEAWAIRTPRAALTHTQDGGRTWQSVPLPGINTRRLPIQRLAFISPQVGWAVLSMGNICRTMDGGRTWSLMGQVPSSPIQAVFSDAQNGFALDLVNAPKTYWTRDGGATWAPGQLPPLPDKLPLQGLYALDSLTAWAVGTRGTILRTTDGGATWRAQPSGVRNGLQAIHFVDKQHGWAVGELNLILNTADGGETWTRVEDDLKDWLKTWLKERQP